MTSNLNDLNWAEIRKETVELLQTLIRYKTVNPPGDELEIATFIKESLEREGVEVTLLHPTPSRAQIVARLRGNGSKRPVMLAAHTDVVSVEADQWSMDPFSAEERNGYIYGRGAIDDKGMLAVNMMSIIIFARLKRSAGLVLDRDIIFLAAADEEMGGELGVGWLVENHRELLIDAEFAINEGGRVRILDNGNIKLLLQHAEKISHKVTLTAIGVAGHAGVPRKDNSILALGRALASISDYASNPANGVSPTILNGGSKYNVIPSEASVLINIRTRPDQDIDNIVATLMELISDSAIKVDIVERGADAPASPVDSEMFEAIRDATIDMVKGGWAGWNELVAANPKPEITVEPYLSNGITDSARLRNIGIKSYGILPFPLTLDEESRMHGKDERVPVAGLEFGVRLITKVLSMTSAPNPHKEH